MAHNLPYLWGTSGGLNAQLMYPFTRSVSFLTSVNQFANAKEQRWPKRPPLYSFTAPMPKLLATDKAAWLTLFNAETGRFGQDMVITQGSTAYGNLTLMSDQLAVTNPDALMFNQDINLRQVSNAAWTAPSAPTAFPVFSWGGSCGRPTTQIQMWYTNVEDSLLGPRYGLQYYGVVSGFPAGSLRMWRITYQLMSDADMATLETFFLAAQGRYHSFTFVDPFDGTTQSHVRFDSDVLDIKYMTVNQNSTTVTLIQTYLS